jgi:mannose-6-phosphate isomerase
MYRLDNRIKEYAWGSRTAIAELLGRPIPSARPDAELWLGAHPTAPSRVERQGRWESLFDLIARAPETELGPRVVSKFGPRLPFLFKVLAAEEPLSLQAHPDAEQARAGFENEERRRIPLDAPHRNYKDRSHKPELLCALGPFDLLCGFRRARDTARLLRALGVSALESGASALELEPDARGLKRLVSWLFATEGSLRSELVLATLDACAVHIDARGEFARECQWVLRVGSMYPGDIGVVIALLLNLVRLEAGQAVYLGPGSLHAYLKGVGLEIMANSDNVLRCGLTPKHVDVDELLRVLTFADEAAHVTSPLGDGPEQVYEAPASEFRLSRIAARRSLGFESGERQGPEILLCVDGSVTFASSNENPYALEKGTSLFIAASSGAYTLNGEGTVFRATVGAL